MATDDDDVSGVIRGIMIVVSLPGCRVVLPLEVVVEEWMDGLVVARTVP
jgi:hypothetical protein